MPRPGRGAPRRNRQMSRSDCRATAAPASTNPKPSPSSIGQTISVSYGRVCSTQPKGESQAGQALVMLVRSSLGVPAALPMPRIRNVATSTQTVREFAPREVRMNCAASRPMPRNAMPHDAAAAPVRSDPPAGSPVATSASVVSAASTTFARMPCTMVAIVGRRRPAGVAHTSSARPASSSPRVCRTARNVLMSAASSASHGSTSKARKAPSDVPEGRPRNIRITGFASAAARMFCRSARVAYDWLTPAYPANAISAVPTIHRVSCSRSRRSRCRSSTPKALITHAPSAHAARGGWRGSRRPSDRPPRPRASRGHRRSGAGTAPRAKAARRAGR